uniref:Uncharacterized protein n=1 Tax=Leersia perrieri TaxID=77586 RepID=A0A0D9UXQ9_9ORYZ
MPIAMFPNHIGTRGWALLGNGMGTLRPRQEMEWIEDSGTAVVAVAANSNMRIVSATGT